MPLLDKLGETAARFAFASLLPIGVLIGAIYFVVDTAIRGVENQSM